MNTEQIGSFITVGKCTADCTEVIESTSKDYLLLLSKIQKYFHVTMLLDHSSEKCHCCSWKYFRFKYFSQAQDPWFCDATTFANLSSLSSTLSTITWVILERNRLLEWVDINIRLVSQYQSAENVYKLFNCRLIK